SKRDWSSDVCSSDLKFEADREIHLYTRELGSGTRSAFTSVAHLTDENGDDILSPKATVQNSTSATIQAVESDLYGISYIYLGTFQSYVYTVTLGVVIQSLSLIRIVA